MLPCCLPASCCYSSGTSLLLRRSCSCSECRKQPNNGTFPCSFGSMTFALRRDPVPVFDGFSLRGWVRFLDSWMDWRCMKLTMSRDAQKPFLQEVGHWNIVTRADSYSAQNHLCANSFADLVHRRRCYDGPPQYSGMTATCGVQLLCMDGACLAIRCNWFSGLPDASGKLVSTGMFAGYCLAQNLMGS